MKLQVGDRVGVTYGLNRYTIVHIGSPPTTSKGEAVYYALEPGDKGFEYKVDGKTFRALGWDRIEKVIFHSRPTPTLDLTKPLQTQDGRPVKFIQRLCDDVGSILGIITEPGDGNYETAYTWRPDGSPQKGGFPGLQLVNVPPPKKKGTRWLVMYADGAIYQFSKRPADKGAHKIIAAKEITIEEGEGMDKVCTAKRCSSPACACGVNEPCKYK